MKSAYGRFLELKQIKLEECGIDVPLDALNPKLFDFQKDIVRWALRKGRAALFCDCGLGKTPMQLEWANRVPGRVLILAPLAVAQQTIREANKFGIEAAYARESCSAKITVTNYEMLSHFSAADYHGIVLDESSILKSFDGVFRNQIISTFNKTPFRLACTATPAPNDYMELGNHSEFLGALSRTEMLSTFFVHDGGDTSKWRLKRHAERDFWKWICSWGVMVDGEFLGAGRLALATGPRANGTLRLTLERSRPRTVTPFQRNRKPAQLRSAQGLGTHDECFQAKAMANSPQGGRQMHDMWSVGE